MFPFMPRLCRDLQEPRCRLCSLRRRRQGYTTPKNLGEGTMISPGPLSRAPLNGLLCLDSEGSSCFPCASTTGQAAMPVCSHEGCSNFFHSPGRALVSERLSRVVRHQRSLSRVVRVVYCCRRHCRGERRQQGSYKHQTVKNRVDSPPYF